MSVHITVGPPVLIINRGRTFMVTGQSGEIDPAKAQGVFAADTRFVSAYRLWVNGESWQHVSSAAVDYHTARIYLQNGEIPWSRQAPGVHAGTLGLSIVRTVDAGIEEDLALSNYGQDAVNIVLALELMSDFADLFEVKIGKIEQRGNLVTQWNRRRAELTTTYTHQDFLRRFTYRVVNADDSPSHANGRLIFPIHLEPGKTWRACGHLVLQHGHEIERPEHGAASTTPPPNRANRLHDRWIKDCASIVTPNVALEQSYRQSVRDMGALRLFEHDLGPDTWVPAAGVPWFVTLFGRDSLIASLECMTVEAGLAAGALRTLAKYQADKRDDWRDAQPGKIPHEIRHGELAHFNLIPHAMYYGTWDATPLYLITLHQAWRWLHDPRLIEDLRDTAIRCLEWIDQWGDIDGDGFQEYQTYSSEGYDNMSWKDAGDAIVYPDGTQVLQPKATCELQGYVYAARLGAAELFDVLGDQPRAAALRQQAADLKRQFNEAFWMPDEGTYALGLDPKKRQIKTIASNAGHCLWTGIADPDKARQVVERLLAPDMWSGWGIRTLSMQNPAYNPLSYQRGSVWPHDNALIAAGMKRYGFAEEANRVAHCILRAAAHFTSYRLPEVYAGIEREPELFPIQYPAANIPQAWAAGSIFLLLQAMLGLEADAPAGRLWVNPTLPDWVPALELKGLVVGKTRLHLSFQRDGDASTYAVVARQGEELEVKLGVPSEQVTVPKGS